VTFKPALHLWEQLSCSISESWRDWSGSGLVSRKGRVAAPDNLRIKAEILGPLCGPIATQGRSHRARVAR